MRRKIIVGLSVISLILFFSVGTSTAGWFFNVNLVKADAGTGGIYVTIADDSGNALAQAPLDSSFEKTGLAVALTAQSMGQKVHVKVDDGTGAITQVVLSTEQ